MSLWSHCRPVFCAPVPPGLTSPHTDTATPVSLTLTPSHPLHPRSAAVDPPSTVTPPCPPPKVYGGVYSKVHSESLQWKSTVKSTVKVYSQAPPPQPASTHSPPLSLSPPPAHTCPHVRRSERHSPSPSGWMCVCVWMDGWMAVSPGATLLCYSPTVPVSPCGVAWYLSVNASVSSPLLPTPPTLSTPPLCPLPPHPPHSSVRGASPHLSPPHHTLTMLNAKLVSSTRARHPPAR